MLRSWTDGDLDVGQQLLRQFATTDVDKIAQSMYRSPGIVYFHFAVYFFDHVKEAKESHRLVSFCSLQVRQRSRALHTYYLMPLTFLPRRTQVKQCTHTG